MCIIVYQIAPDWTPCGDSSIFTFVICFVVVCGLAACLARAFAYLYLDEPESEFDKHSPTDGSWTEEFMASITCADDPTPTRRWMASMRAISKGQHSRKKGIDMKHVL